MTASRPLERGADAAWLAADDEAPDVRRLVTRAAGDCAAASAAGCGAVLVLRRLAGAIQPGDPALVLGVVAAGIVLVLVADAARRAGGSRAAPLAARCGLVLAVATLVLPPRAAVPAEWLAIAAAITGTAAAVALPTWPGGSARAAVVQPSARSIRRPAGGPRRSRPARPGLLRQRFERRELPAGAERVHGRVVVAVPAAAKAGYGHLGFCPAFATTPTVEVTTSYDGVEATVTAAEVLPWGVRVECRLAEPAEEPLEIPVDLVAVAAAPTS